MVDLANYCPACQAIPSHGYCQMAGCPKRAEVLNGMTSAGYSGPAKPSPAPRVSAEMVEDMDALAHWFKTVPEPGTYAATTMLGRVMRVRSALIAALAVSEGK